MINIRWINSLKCTSNLLKYKRPLNLICLLFQAKNEHGSANSDFVKVRVEVGVEIVEFPENIRYSHYYIYRVIKKNLVLVF